MLKYFYILWCVVILCVISQENGCRCTPKDTCWEQIPWSSLNSSVNGHLVPYTDPLEPCSTDPNSQECSFVLGNSNKEFWITDQPNGYIHTGFFNTWNLSTVVSAYTLKVHDDSEIQTAVRFANTYNIRLVVKSTGHDWFGRSSAYGSLVIWTHLRTKISFSDSFTPSGCRNLPAVPAAIIQSGVQFKQLYSAALNNRKLVTGGNCNSVGVGGCYLGGCYGTFSRLFGPSASNILEAKVVLANGDLITVNQCTHSDLFWSLKGGGAGLGGIVTEYILRTHKAPDFVVLGDGEYHAKDMSGFQLLMELLLNYTKKVSQPEYSGFVGFGAEENGGFVSFNMHGYELNSNQWEEEFTEPFKYLVRTQPERFSGITTTKLWKLSNFVSGVETSFPWIWEEPDVEISTEILHSSTRYLSIRSLKDNTQVVKVANKLVQVSKLLPKFRGYWNIYLDKGQAGASDYATALFTQTSQNPVVLQSVGMILLMFNVPSLPTIPLSSSVLKYLWPRLKSYVFLDSSDSLYRICELGAQGDEDQAKLCESLWINERVKDLQDQMKLANNELWESFPNIDKEGLPISGSYFSEGDYHLEEWRQSYWGDVNYQRLYEIKQRYDPKGLFICHHCVGSEDWDVTGTCRIRRGH